jgi:hypothetical protein
MDSTQTAARPHHGRNKSASVLRSIITSRPSKSSPSDDRSPPARLMKDNAQPFSPFLAGIKTPILPPNHPHSGQRVLGEITQNNNNQVSRHPPAPTAQRPKLQKNTPSSRSLRSMGKAKEESPGKSKHKATKDTHEDRQSPERTKSSTNLASVFSKVKSSKGQSDNQGTKDKENTTPPGSAVNTPHTPIWAQFASAGTQKLGSTTKVPLNDGRTIEEEIALYEPKDYSPSKQRNFHDYFQPTLGGAPRPKSEVITTNPSSTSFFDAITRKSTNEDPFSHRRSLIGSRRTSSDEQDGHGRGDKTRSSKSKPGSPTSKYAMSIPKRESRVKAAVAAINSRTKKTVSRRGDQLQEMDPEEIDAAFEAVLVSNTCFTLSNS